MEDLANRADSRGAARRANDLRAVAEHLRAKEVRGTGEARAAGAVRKVTVDVRPAALARHRRPPADPSGPSGPSGRSRLRGALRALGRRVRRLVTR